MLLMGRVGPNAGGGILEALGSLGLVVPLRCCGSRPAANRRLWLREEADDVLIAVDRLERLERETDRTLRRVQAALIGEPPPQPEFHLGIEIARCLEHATDALMRAALMIHDHVLGDVLRR